VRIKHNDYGQPPASYRPELTVTVVVPAHGCQEKLDLTLAALSVQTYPLMDVIVVDDGSPVPLKAPNVIRAPEGGWGRAWAVQAGLEAATGDVVLVLDADMVPEHVDKHMRWHHLADYLVVLGWIDFTASPLPTPEDLLRKPYEELFDLAEQRHDWAEQIIAEHDGLRTAPNSLAGHVHVGATASYRRDFLIAAGGLDTSLVLAEDTELGYRLTQAGAVFVPDPEARAWHLGLPTAMRDYAAMKRHNDPYVADRVPYRRYLRTDRGRQWLVPYVDAVVVAAGYEDTRAAVDALLASDLPDLRVTVVGAPRSATRSWTCGCCGRPSSTTPGYGWPRPSSRPRLSSCAARPAGWPATAPSRAWSSTWRPGTAGCSAWRWRRTPTGCLPCGWNARPPSRAPAWSALRTKRSTTWSTSCSGSSGWTAGSTASPGGP
jgi:glycosyltransferase involved in cell wall biosynthesis